LGEDYPIARLIGFVGIASYSGLMAWVRRRCMPIKGLEGYHLLVDSLDQSSRMRCITVALYALLLIPVFACFGAIAAIDGSVDAWIGLLGVPLIGLLVGFVLGGLLQKRARKSLEGKTVQQSQRASGQPMPPT